jgi:hypothetical protein
VRVQSASGGSVALPRSEAYVEIPSREFVSWDSAMVEFLCALNDAMKVNAELIHVLIPIWAHVVKLRDLKLNRFDATLEMVIQAMPVIRDANIKRLKDSLELVQEEMRRCK